MLLTQQSNGDGFRQDCDQTHSELVLSARLLWLTKAKAEFFVNLERFHVACSDRNLGATDGVTDG